MHMTTTPQVEKDGGYMGPISIREYKKLARDCIETSAWKYYQRGSDDEVTLRNNRAAFERIRLRPRMLVNASACDLRTTALGLPVSMPVFIAPTAFHGLAHPEGECATAQAADKAGTLMVASTSSTRSLEEIAGHTNSPLWFQLYVQGHRSTEKLVHRAEEAGYRAIALSVDSSRWERKKSAIRGGFSLAPHLSKANFTAEDMAEEAMPLTWHSVAWVRSITSLPILLKGILTAEDAVLAVEHGVDGIIVSNHGGRQLDSVQASIEALPEVVEAAGQHCEIYIDSGIRRGTDVLKAIALGARAVLVGRPILWGLAVNGADGAHHVLELLRAELEQDMIFAGLPTIASINRSLVKLP